MKLKIKNFFTSSNEDFEHVTPPPKQLETLLEQEDILFRCKQLTDGNLVKFLTRGEIVDKALDYVTGCAKDTLSINILPGNVASDLRDKLQDEVKLNRLVDDKIKTNYPNTVTEIMCSVIGKNYILPKIAQQKLYLKKFLSVLSVPHSSLNVNGTKQYIRVFSTMVNNTENHPALFSYFYKHKGDAIVQLLNLIQTEEQPVSNIIRTALLFDPEKFSKNQVDCSIDFSSTKTQIIQRLIQEIKVDEHTDAVCELLEQLVMSSRPSVMVDVLVGKECVQSVMDTLFENQHDSRVCDCCMHLLEKIVFASRVGDPCTSCLLNLFERLASALTDPGSLESMELTTGQMSVPFGFFRLRAVQFFSYIFDNLNEIDQHHTNDSETTMDVTQSLLNNKVLETLLNLFFEYENNNILHSYVTEIVQNVLSSESSSKLNKFVSNILAPENGIITKLIEKYKKNKELLEERKPALGYIGHLIQIGYTLSDMDLEEEKMEELFAGWGDFLSYIKDRFFVETMYSLGGDIPLPDHLRDWNSQEDEEDEFGLNDSDDDTEENNTANDDSNVDSNTNSQPQNNPIEDEFQEETSSSNKPEKPSGAIQRPPTPAITPNTSASTQFDQAALSSEKDTTKEVQNAADLVQSDLDAKPVSHENDDVDWFLNDK